MDFSMSFEGVRNNLCPVRSISPAEGHYFFGYYDLMAYSPDGRRHLAAKVPFDRVLNTKDDVMEFGYLEDGKFTKLLDTKCWNFQQGILGQYQWNGGNVIFYNIFDEAAGCYRTVRHDLDTGEKKQTSMGCASVSRDGRYGLGVNFSRIWDFRPGYGYPNLPDPYFDIPQPKEDGVFLCDFETGATRQLFDCETLGKQFPLEGRENAKMVVNHITFNPSGTRYLFLYRNFRDPDKMNAPWNTTLFVGDLHGNVSMIFDEMVSHYWWEDDDHMVAFCRPKGEQNGVWRVNMVDGTYEEIGGENGGSLRKLTNGWDIHCSISPDGRYLVGDDYPNRISNGYRNIFIHELATGRTEILLSTYSPDPRDPVHGVPNGSVDARCDLHARWNRDGSRLSFDTIARGHREIFEVDMTKLPSLSSLA